MPFGYELIVIALMLVLNAVLAAYEMALASISKTRLGFLLGEKKRGSLEASYMKEHMEASLTVIQIGITLAGVCAAATGGAGIETGFAPFLHDSLHVSMPLANLFAMLFFIIPLGIIMIIFAELVPKMLGLHNKEWVVLSLSPTMRVFLKVLTPLVGLIEKITKYLVAYGKQKWTVTNINEARHGLYELIAAASLARSSRLFGAREEKIVLAAAHLATRPVREIITPAPDISMLFQDSSLMDAFLRAHLDMHTRFPVSTRENDPQTIQGYVNFKDIVVAVKANPGAATLKGIVRPIMNVREEMPLSQLLEKMMQEKAHIVIVYSENRHVLGMVTMEDIIEELVGEIEDEFDRPLTHIHAYGAAWIIGGGVAMNTVLFTVGLNWQGKFKEGPVPTLSEWCIRELGRPLKGGEIIEKDGLYVMPRKFRRKKLAEALVSTTRPEVPAG
ncbi:MAG: hemolysin family protein [Candidatus Omnitrophica bacterium]|nr:hemolysin family protein [Candidatus Omnitrophota bacterium]